MFDHGTVLSAQPGRVPSPPPEFADAALGAAGLDTFVLDLHAEAPAAVRAWLDASAKVRLIGPSFDPDDNAAYHLSGGSLAEWFDIIVHAQTATPNHPLIQGTQPAGTG